MNGAITQPDCLLHMSCGGLSLYKHEPSLPLLCVPACINMILVRWGYPAIPQAEIARELGLVVPQRLSAEYPFAEVSEIPKDWGVRPATVESRICSLLGARAPNLRHTFQPWQRVPRSFELEFIAKQLAGGTDVMVGFRASDVYDGTEPVGHVAVIAAVDTRAEVVCLMDPEVGTEEGVVVSWTRLLTGIMAVRDGYWLFGDNPASLRVGATF